MPAASVQSRIQAFEALSSSPSSVAPKPAPGSRTTPSSLLESPISPTASAFHPIAPFVTPISSNRSRSPSPSPPSLTSLIDLKDWIVEDGPVDPPLTLHNTLVTRVGKSNAIHESSRPLSSAKPPQRNAANLSAPLIDFERPTKPRPPLPPRKLSSTSTDHVSAQRSVSADSEINTALRPPDSLTVEHTYPPDPHKFGAGRVGHAPASSISSFHSVSLSSDGNNIETWNPSPGSKPSRSLLEMDSNIADLDTSSIAESFENVSTPSAASPSINIPFDWEQATSKPKTSLGLEPPTLPYRPAMKITPIVSPKALARSVSTSSSSTASSTKTRRAPPPPPPPYRPRSRPTSSRASVVSISASTSDRSSILSNATTSRTSISTQNSVQHKGSIKSSPLLRPTPVPPTARLRYQSLFDSAVQGRQEAEKKTRDAKLLAPPFPFTKKGRQAAGWRGLSVDLVINPNDHLDPSEKYFDEGDSEEKEQESSIASKEKLNGRTVKYIWNTSRLDRKTLESIWNECDSQCTGFLDRDAFVRGMWRIDEELRKAQLARRTSALAAASSQRIPHRPLPSPRPPTTLC